MNEAETTVIINIRDVNDLPPAFVEQSYQTTVFEETKHVHRPILKVGRRPGLTEDRSRLQTKLTFLLD